MVTSLILCSFPLGYPFSLPNPSEILLEASWLTVVRFMLVKEGIISPSDPIDRVSDIPEDTDPISSLCISAVNLFLSSPTSTLLGLLPLSEDSDSFILSRFFMNVFRIIFEGGVDPRPSFSLSFSLDPFDSFFPSLGASSPVSSIELNGTIGMSSGSFSAKVVPLISTKKIQHKPKKTSIIQKKIIINQKKSVQTNNSLVLNDAFVMAVFDTPVVEATTLLATLEVGERDDRTIPSGLSSLS